MASPPAVASRFRESARRNQPIRDLGLRIEGTRLESLVAAFRAELVQVGLERVQPRVYLSTEWGVAMGSTAIAIPFYLVDVELTAYHKERVGHLEGFSDADILRYLRHEMGHVVNYAYKLYQREDWTTRFGPISKPYLEDYHPRPFSRSYVRHLPGWYAQKHPDEDWAESFAVWMTPGIDWRTQYKAWPRALEKLEYVGSLVEHIKAKEPETLSDDLDEPVTNLPYSVEQYYEALTDNIEAVPADLDGLLGSVFPPPQAAEPSREAAALILSLETALLDQVFIWTGHFPERTRALVRQMASHAQSLSLRYAKDDEPAAIVGLTTLICALAMNHVVQGSYYE
ncbi:MAG: hypothetical protein SF187_28445 [Deltaproteobacteria bacterium]|nr:hypothetical protein [Deltaproteobacteria bacterium]